MAGYSRDDFDVPVEDYNFEEITDVKSLIDQMGKAGGFTAAKLSRARDILSDTIGTVSYTHLTLPTIYSV